MCLVYVTLMDYIVVHKTPPVYNDINLQVDRNYV